MNILEWELGFKFRRPNSKTLQLRAFTEVYPEAEVNPEVQKRVVDTV